MNVYLLYIELVSNQNLSFYFSSKSKVFTFLDHQISKELQTETEYTFLEDNTKISIGDILYNGQIYNILDDVYFNFKIIQLNIL